MNKDPHKLATETLSGRLVDVATRTQESIRQPWKTPMGPPRRRAWVWAVGVAVAWHLAWVYMLAPVTRTSTRPVPTPVVATFLFPSSGPNGNTKDDLRQFLSPVVFALPSEIGFSRTVIDQELSLPPPVNIASKNPLFLKNETDRLLKPIHAVRGLDQQVRSVMKGVALEPVRPRAFSAINTEKAVSPIQVRLAGELKASALVDFTLPEVTRLPGGKAWEAIAYVEVEPEGRVRRVVLEEPAPSVRWNMLLTRTIYQFAFNEADELRRGRVVIGYAGATPANGEKEP